MCSWGYCSWFVVSLLLLTFILGDRVFNYFVANVRAIGLGVDGDEDDAVFGSEVVNDTVAAAFAFLDAAVFETNFEDGVLDSRDAIARQFTGLKLGN